MPALLSEPVLRTESGAHARVNWIAAPGDPDKGRSAAGLHRPLVWAISKLNGQLAAALRSNKVERVQISALISQSQKQFAVIYAHRPSARAVAQLGRRRRPKLIISVC